MQQGGGGLAFAGLVVEGGEGVEQAAKVRWILVLPVLFMPAWMMIFKIHAPTRKSAAAARGCGTSGQP